MRLFRYLQSKLRRRSKKTSLVDGGWVSHAERRRAMSQHHGSVKSGHT